MSVEGQRKFTGILHDLSARVQLEEQLRANEVRWRTIVESAVDAIIVIDGQGRVEAFIPLRRGCSATPTRRPSAKTYPR